MSFVTKTWLLLTIAAALMISLHSATKHEVHDVPISVITCPFMPELNDKKTEHLMKTIEKEEKIGKVPPIDIIWITETEREFYYSFTGCHRYAAYKKLGRYSIPAKLIRSTVQELRDHLAKSIQ